jgi:hypothetical protein
MMATYSRTLMQFLFITVFIFPFLVCGCGTKSPERHYQEVVIKAPASTAPFMGEDPHAGLGLDIPIIKKHTREDNTLAWDIPAGWQEEPGSGMRVATFKLAQNPDEIDVSIVSLGGIAGGLEANLARWATQINLKLAADDDLPKLISGATTLTTRDGSKAQIFDFTQLQQGQDPSTKSTIAAILELDDTTVFVKMTGTIQAVLKNKEAFQQLTQSVRKK